MRWIWLALVLLLVVVFAALTTTTQPIVVPSQSPSPSTPISSMCVGRDPKANVYHPDRLVLIETCKTVTGVVDTVRHEADGDIHIGLRLDAGQESLLNAANQSGQNGDLVLEIICAGTVTQADAVSACASYTNPVATPALGRHIAVTGPYVLDTAHGWNEIHPVFEWH